MYLQTLPITHFQISFYILGFDKTASPLHSTNFVSLFIQAAMTKYHKLDELINNRNLVLTVMEGGKSQIKVPADLFYSECNWPTKSDFYYSFGDVK